ncbi:unnamed protein product [Discosporangium mesarthrocarpum]
MAASLGLDLGLDLRAEWGGSGGAWGEGEGNDITPWRASLWVLRRMLAGSRWAERIDLGTRASKGDRAVEGVDFLSPGPRDFGAGLCTCLQWGEWGAAMEVWSTYWFWWGLTGWPHLLRGA